jgi:hypothetical protein
MNSGPRCAISSCYGVAGEIDLSRTPGRSIFSTVRLLTLEGHSHEQCASDPDGGT